MKNKKIIYILLGLTLLMGLTTEIYANTYGHEDSRFQLTLDDKDYHNYYKNGIHTIMLDKPITDSEVNNEIVGDKKASDNKTQSNLDNNAIAPVSRGNTSASKYNAEDLYWLAKIIEAEAEGEPYQGKVAVGNVILNRVDSDEFPDVIYNVIFEYSGNIPQFSPVADGSIHNTPSQDSIRAAKDAVSGVAPVGDATYFFNPSKASGSWIVNNKSYVMNIGGHDFYR